MMMIILYHINLATTGLMASHNLDTDHRIITLESSVKVENQPKLTHGRESVKVDPCSRISQNWHN